MRTLKLTALILMLFAHAAMAQNWVYDNHVYRPYIKTVQCYNTRAEQSFPLINLQNNEQLLLAFDDLQGSVKNFYYTVEHCDATWQKSNLSPVEYLDGITEDRINDYRYSFNTLQKYTHYEIRLPNMNIRPKLAGNYLLKVYENNDQNQPVLSQRFYVLNQKAGVAVQLAPSMQMNTRNTNQKLNIRVQTGGLPVQNPYAEIRVLAMQNMRNDVAQLTSRPQFVRNGELLYTDVSSNDYPGGNEFRRIDMRSFRSPGEHVYTIRKDSANVITLYKDHSRNGQAYSNRPDNNGAFFIRNLDGRDPRTDADYAWVDFLFEGPNEGDLYVVGQFDHYRLNPANALSYDASQNGYTGKIMLKQGVYDFMYRYAGKSPFALEGSFFQTQNEYQVLVYYKAVTARWEELVGFSQIGTR
ncbi:MAG: DUF5103 domain-containing protein [Mucilaginibacter polytrichastri]|nr:DUF5103 domain-containing protein [Mucilaginibacter polytrichastri]